MTALLFRRDVRSVVSPYMSALLFPMDIGPVDSHKCPLLFPIDVRTVDDVRIVVDDDVIESDSSKIVDETFVFPGPLGFRTAPGYPLVIETVHPGTSASIKGLESGDVILAVDGQAISEDNPVTQQMLAKRPLRLRIKYHGRGSAVRGGHTKAVSMD